MSAFEMASVPKLSYQRLRNEGWYEEGEEHKQDAIVIKRTRSWSKNFRRVHLRRRLKIRIPGLRRFLRKKAKLFSAVRLSYNKVIRRFVEGRSHLGDLFAGNYLFMQVSPTPLKCRQKSYTAHHNHVHSFPSRKIAN